jgi:hypothetical protein
MSSSITEKSILFNSAKRFLPQQHPKPVRIAKDKNRIAAVIVSTKPTNQMDSPIGETSQPQNVLGLFSFQQLLWKNREMQQPILRIRLFGLLVD